MLDVHVSDGPLARNKVCAEWTATARIKTALEMDYETMKNGSLYREMTSSIHRRGSSLTSKTIPRCSSVLTIGTRAKLVVVAVVVVAVAVRIHAFVSCVIGRKTSTGTVCVLTTVKR